MAGLLSDDTTDVIPDTSTLPNSDKVTTTITTPPAATPSVLIIGGLGYCGRFLALHIHDKRLASEVRIVDKQLPELAWLAPEFSEACSRSRFIQADASRKGELVPTTKR